jgi:hypothetical protein
VVKAVSGEQPELVIPRKRRTTVDNGDTVSDETIRIDSRASIIEVNVHNTWGLLLRSSAFKFSVENGRAVSVTVLVAGRWRTL